MKTILTFVRATELPDAWVKHVCSDPTRTFRVVLEEEDPQPKHRRDVSGEMSPFAKRQQFLRDMATLGGDEDSDAWIRGIKVARVDAKSREPLT